jgi:hypothetical protein
VLGWVKDGFGGYYLAGGKRTEACVIGLCGKVIWTSVRRDESGGSACEF